ncbi:MAG: alpha-ketoacid dehydrogenase subunit beta, partial [Planctomycetes bacterium]|nr:alpha-ketoacid dehydrogenase subunit beta [Planctomycetota bacterium]
MKSLTYRQAINQALVEEMDRDPAVFVYGLDVSDHKGIF